MSFCGGRETGSPHVRCCNLWGKVPLFLEKTRKIFYIKKCCEKNEMEYQINLGFFNYLLFTKFDLFNNQ